MSPSPSNLKRRLILAAKIVIWIAVLAGIAYTVWRSWDSFQREGFSLWSVDLRWLLLAGLAYLAGLAPCWIYWHQTLHAFGQQPTWGESFRAYFISHLGKYVPGKAMVVVLRAVWVRSKRVDTTVAATSVFVEALTQMAVGAFVSALVIVVLFNEHTLQLVAAIVLMLCAGVPTLPPVFRRAVRFLQVHRANPEIDKALAGLNYRLMLSGWLLMLVCWLVLGLSLWATLSAMSGGSQSFAPPELADMPLLVASTALAIVAGFVSLIPGGIGVRELVLIPLLAPRFGQVTAVVSAVLLRLTWLLSEVAISTILYAWARLARKAATDGEDSA